MGVSPRGRSAARLPVPLFVPEALGYTYGLQAPVVASAAIHSHAVLALQSRLQTVFATPSPAGPGVKTFAWSAPAEATATAEKPLDIAVDVDAGTLRAVAHRTPVSSGTGFAAAREIRSSGPRAIAIIRNVSVTKSQSTEYRVFLGDEQVTAQTPITDPHYVGAFGLFVHGEHGGGHGPKHANPSFAVDLTAAIQRVYGATPPAAGGIKLQILPVASSGTGEVGTATTAKVEVVILSG